MLFLYGVVPGGCPPISADGVARADVRQIVDGDVAALVSDFEGELLARRRDVNAHMDVLEEAMRHGPVLPFRFGTLVHDEAQLRQMFSERAADLRRQLDELNGLVQVTLRISHEEDEVIRHVVMTDQVLRRHARQRRTGMADQIALGESIAAAVAAQAESDRRIALGQILGLAEEVAEAEDPTAVLSLAALLRRERLSTLDSAVAEIGELLGTRAHIDYAGPMPAYSFVDA